MPQKRKILYLGNKLLKSKTATITTLEILSKNLESEGFEVISASSKNNKLLRLLDMLWEVLIYQKKVSFVLIDTYSTKNFWYAVSIANLCKLLSLRYIPILHGGNLPQRLKKNPLQSKKLFYGSYKNVAPSEYLLDEFLTAGFKNTICIPNSIEIVNYSFKKRDVISPKLLWVRSFSEIYNPLLAVKVFEKIKNSYPSATLCMVGPEKDGSLLKCKQYAETKKLSIKFTGKLTKSEWIGLSEEYNLFINTTNFDNMPVSVIEAMALGLPVISTNVGGVPYLINNNTDGLLVPPNDIDAFVERIISICNDDSLAKKLVHHSRTKVEKYDWQNVKHLWLELLKE